MWQGGVEQARLTARLHTAQQLGERKLLAGKIRNHRNCTEVPILQLRAAANHNLLHCSVASQQHLGQPDSKIEAFERFEP